MNNWTGMNNIRIKPIITILFLSLSTLIISSCGSTKAPDKLTEEQLFKHGVEQFDKEDYLEAEKTFEAVMLSYAGGQFYEDSQYFVAECYYKRKEYVTAAFHYNRIIERNPRSKFVRICLFKSALCFNDLSLPYDRDQDYTTKAIRAFQIYQTTFPGDSLSAEANKYLLQLRDKLGHRDFFTAELYRKMFSFRAAIIYYDSVIEDYSDTQYCEDAYLGKIELFVEMKKKDEAIGLMNTYKKNFPSGKHLSKVKELELLVQNK
jgi:outer membrane protein assembly factor BamD